MGNITDEQMDRLAENAPKAAKQTAGALAKAGGMAVREGKTVIQGSGKIAGGAVKGICLVLGQGVPFTTENVMKAFKFLLYTKTGDVKYSNRNINANIFQKNKNVQVLAEAVATEQMGIFDKNCKEFGIKYSAIYDRQKDSYSVLFAGKDEKIIEEVLKRTVRDYDTASYSGIPMRQSLTRKHGTTPKG